MILVKKYEFMKNTFIMVLFFIVLNFCLLYISEPKNVYAYTNQADAVNDLKAHYEQYKSQYPYMVIVRRWNSPTNPRTEYYEMMASNEPIYAWYVHNVNDVFNVTTNFDTGVPTASSSENASKGYLYTVMNYATGVKNTYQNWTFSMGGYTLNVLDWKSFILYSVGNVYSADIIDDKIVKTNIIVHEADIPSMGGWDGVYMYQFDSSIPDVDNVKILSHSYLDMGWLKLLVSRDKYNISWDVPTDSTLGFEISFKATYYDGNTSNLNPVRIYKKQTYNKPFNDDGSYVKPTDGTVRVSEQKLGKEILKYAFSNVTTSSTTFVIPPEYFYIRFIKTDESAHKILHGNWTRCQFIHNANGIKEHKNNTVSVDESLDDDGNVVYTDTVVEGTETKYYSTGGAELTEEETWYGTAKSIDGALSTFSSTMGNAMNWIGQVPSLIGALFVFLPPEILVIIGLGISVLIILRIAGR